MHVNFVLTQDSQRELAELAALKGVEPETLNYAIAFFGYRKELRAQLKRARAKAAAAKENGCAATAGDGCTATAGDGGTPAPIQWDAVDKPARGQPTPINWPAAMAAIESGEVVV